MHFSTLRTAIGRLAIMLTSAALGACADQPITSPTAQPNVPSTAAAEVVPTADADSTRVTVTIARDENYYFESTGYVQVHGTMTCSRALGEQITMYVNLRQKLPAKGAATGFVRQTVTCSTTVAQPWTAVIPPSSNGFYAGRALVSVETLGVLPGVAGTTASENVRLALSQAF